ncbi:M20/M25/M40 family metallo-hydrolase [Novosphingobium sp. 1949]|uniref:Vacuolar membrane protease n=1 Tax=Novosphingobium organovorum TaxID=2930092 RepID=A0ABT0B9W0_9SPHN|nr:M20/M25/M40 family metallo-hydrolase [Novosphingobium organovorum]MCJ2181734.1 M20/M25/M40 family metallo-hydrolase [Novosphingobium organovorum]
MRSWLPFWIFAIVAAGFAVLGTTPPLSRAEYAAADGFSARHAMRDIAVIARAPHPSGSVEIARVRAALVARLAHAGLAVRLQEGVFPPQARAVLEERSGRKAGRVALVNVIARLPGRDPTLPALLLMAHYDSVEGSPGAADDGAGVATILGVVDTLSRMQGRRRDVYVVFTDGEEAGLVGARLFFARAPERERIGAIINLETRGGGGKANLFQTSPDNGEVAALWARSVAHPAGSSLATYIYSLLPNDTDLTVGLPLGVPAWNFAFIGRPGLYHSPLATPENLDRGALQQMGNQTLGLARALVMTPALPRPSPDRVFFDAFGLFVVSYAPVWGWAMLGLAAFGLILGAGREFDGRAVVAGAGRMLAFLLACVVLLSGLDWLSHCGQALNYYDRLAATPRLQVMALLTGLAVIIALLGRRPASPSGVAGFALPPFVLALIVQVLAPVAAYVLVIPMLGLGLVMATRRFVPAKLADPVAAVIGALASGYTLAIGYSIFQAVGAGLAVVAALPAMIVAVFVAALRPTGKRPETGPRLIAAALLLGALALALWVRFDPLAPSVPPYSGVRPAIGGK